MTAPSKSPKRSAALVGLRHVDDGEPGYRRIRAGKGFAYKSWSGRAVRGRRLLERFANLAIPPAWQDVWICRHANGHIQATGRDEAGRKQYIYHPRWRSQRDREKYRRIVAFGASLPRIRARVRRDLAREGLGRERVLAAVVRLLDTSLARIGNDEYARENHSFGLTTLRKRHVRRSKGGLVLRFSGKGGRAWELEVDDPKILQVVDTCLSTPGWKLFKYFDERGRKRDVTSADVNAYLSDIAGADVTAKDFRTWAGTVLTSVALVEAERTLPDAKTKRKIRSAIAAVADKLGNTPAICQQCYVHPEVLETAAEGAVVEYLEAADARGLRKAEEAVLSYLDHERSPPKKTGS
jgi:DNA topoisomerase I